MKKFTIPLKLRGKVEGMTLQELIVLKSYLEKKKSHVKTRAFLIFF